jgi:hypothetical protein
MIKTTDLSDAQLDALIHHYKRIRERIADNVTAMTRLEALVMEKTNRITAITVLDIRRVTEQKLVRLVRSVCDETDD